MSPIQEYAATTDTDTTVTTTSETEAVQLDGVTSDGSRRIILEGNLRITTGAGTTALTLRVRRGTDTTGTLVGEATAVQIEAAAGSTEDHDIVVEDTPGELARGSYVLTVQQTAATGNGTIANAVLTATVRQ